jgi:uncharacterized protein (TIGR03067 family)
MKHTITVLFLLTGIAVADEAANKKILKDIEGKYTAVSMVKAGEPGPKTLIDSVSFTIKGDSFIVTFKTDGKEDSKEATVVIVADKDPINIDLTPKDGPEAGKPMLGIMKIEKDTVKLCWCDSNVRTERPTKFESTKENGNFLVEIKKSK